MNAIREMNVLVPFSLNISPKLLTRAKLPDKIEEILKNNDLKNDAIIVEISETSALRDDAQTLEVLSRLRMKGMGVAIDDFGVDYSNSQQLLSLPFSQMKVDRHFVHLAEKDKVAQLAIEYDYQLAQKLKVEIVFDGVNDEHCFACLINFPHAIVQGDALAASMNLDELLNWCDGWLTCEQKNWLDKITQMATL